MGRSILDGKIQTNQAPMGQSPLSIMAMALLWSCSGHGDTPAVDIMGDW